MKCKFCGEELKDGANFCEFCGKEQEALSALLNRGKGHRGYD
ncbi:MAG: zinc-ribbon domain-containing protein [Eubacteriales bacterium]